MKINLPNKYLNFTFSRSIVAFIFIGVLIACNFEEVEEDVPQDAEVSITKNQNPEDKENTIVNTTEETIIKPSGILTNEDLKLSESLILDKNKKFTTKILSQNEYNKFLTKDGDVTLITKDIYKHYKDDFDFIIILGVEKKQPEGLGFLGRNLSAQNKVQGLGGDTFNQATRFGAKDKLQGIIYMPVTEYIKSGPFLHELAHTWGNRNFIPTTVSGHWGYSSAGGQLGGFDTLTSLGNNTYKGTVAGRTSFGTFANGGNSIPYSNLELYLMGLIGENELKPVQVAVNPKATNKSGEFTADRIDTFSVTQLIEKNGKRIPTVENSQKTFKSLTVIISPSELSPNKKKEINDLIDPFFKKEPSGFEGTLNFWEATKGKASIENTVTNENLL